MKSSRTGEWIQDKRGRAVLDTGPPGHKFHTKNKHVRAGVLSLAQCQRALATLTAGDLKPCLYWSATHKQKNQLATKSTSPTLAEFHQGGLEFTFFINITSDDILAPKTSLSKTLLQGKK